VSDTVTYVYAVARAADDPGVAGLQGVGGAPVRTVVSGDLQAVVSDAGRAEFEERALEEQLEDLAWLTATARAHHHVVDAVGHRCLVAPLSLATVYYADDRVREVLDAGRATFGAILDQLAGRSEWGVKAWVRARTAASDEGRARSGSDYLRRRRDTLRRSEAVADEARAEGDALHEAVAALGVADRRLRLQDAALSETTEQMILNGAYLVPEENVDELHALVEARTDDERLRLELTGPWVPYSFAQGAPGTVA
jgi:hypothetical protein